MSTESLYHQFTPKDLWGKNGQPDPGDVEQKKFGDCYFVAAAGAVALQTPDLIRNAIAFDESSGQFSVRLFHNGKWTRSLVSQNELRDNLKEGGGSSYASAKPNAGGGLWPAVYEVAYAKLRWGNWEHGSARLRQGGDPADALQAITGELPRTIFSRQVESAGMQIVAREINAELKAGKRVLLATNEDPLSDIAADVKARFTGSDAPRGTRADGVVGNHVYMVVAVRYDALADDARIRLINPWGNNQVHGPLGHKREGEWSQQAEIEISLRKLIAPETRSFNRFNSAQLQPADRALFDAIKQPVGGNVEDAAIAMATRRASQDGIVSPAQLHDAFQTEDGKLWVTGKQLGQRISIDTRAECLDVHAADQVADMRRQATDGDLERTSPALRLGRT